MELKCPECGSQNVQTTLKGRYCRRCGYFVTLFDKDEFEQEESK